MACIARAANGGFLRRRTGGLDPLQSPKSLDSTLNKRHSTTRYVVGGLAPELMGQSASWISAGPVTGFSAPLVRTTDLIRFVPNMLLKNPKVGSRVVGRTYRRGPDLGSQRGAPLGETTLRRAH